MSPNPLNELKRRLDDDNTPLAKRLCLAKNVVQSHHFPTAPKERVLAEWLADLSSRNKLTGEELKDVLGWFSVAEDLTSELKTRLIQMVSQYLQTNPAQDSDIQYILAFLENAKISSQLSSQIDNYLHITATLLQHLRIDANKQVTQKIFNHIVKYYKDSKKKLEFIVKFLNGEHVETLFSYVETDCRDNVLNVCQNILFPMNKRSFFASLLLTLIRKDNIDNLIAEKGDNIQSVLKIMNTFFEFPNGRSENDHKFLSDFIEVFVSCFKTESQLVYAFYVMVADCLDYNQNYMIPSTRLPKINFENSEKTKRNLFLHMMDSLHRNEIDISVRLTDTLGENVPKGETKKNFLTFLQTVMMGQIKLEGKPDKTTLLIIKTALKLDPTIVEQKLEEILPPIMTAKKSGSSVEAYKDMLTCLLEILFKLSKGISFIDQILPLLRLNLENSNTEQLELMKKISKASNDGEDCTKLSSKVITGSDLFPAECVELYGRLTSELLFRQNKELLVVLQKDLQEYCLDPLQAGDYAPSTLILTEVLSSMLCSWVSHTKMADHTVPRHVAQDFWETFENFQQECMRRFGECVVGGSSHPRLLTSFLQLCTHVAQLRILRLRYDTTHDTTTTEDDNNRNVVNTSPALDLSVLLPWLSGEQWIAIAGMVEDEQNVVIMDNLLLLKTIAIQIISTRNSVDNDEAIASTKAHLIKQLPNYPQLLSSNYLARVLLTNLQNNQLKQVSKSLVKLCLNNSDTSILKNNAVSNNRELLNALVLETTKNITKSMENVDDLSKALNKIDFDFISFVKDIDMVSYFSEISLKEGTENDLLINCVDILKQLQIYYLEENYQLIAIFSLLALKKCCPTKKIRKNIDNVLLSIFELSTVSPDVYKIFPVQYIFNFEKKSLLDLLTLKIKTSNNMLVIKCMLESAVKMVRTNSELIKNITDLLIKKQNKKDDNHSIDRFSDPTFQISCILLPIIVKHKKNLTASAFRTILTDSQEKLNKTMLESFKNIDFGSISSISVAETGNIDESMVVCESSMATLNAMASYTLILSKYCESSDAEEIKNLECLWAGLEFFVNNALQTIQSPLSKPQQVDCSIHLINTILRHYKKLETHNLFKKKDQLVLNVWNSVKTLLLQGKSASVTEEAAVTVKFVCELASVDCFSNKLLGDLTEMSVLKKPSQILKDEASISTEITQRNITKYLWSNCLKSNIIGPKCVAISKHFLKTSKNLRSWIQQHYGSGVNATRGRNVGDLEEEEVRLVNVEDQICEVIKTELDVLAEVIMSAKKISMDYKLLDGVFELVHTVLHIMGLSALHTRCTVACRAYLALHEGAVAILNSMLMAREELLEDRWSCYMQCYRGLVACLCERAANNTHTHPASHTHISLHLHDTIQDDAIIEDAPLEARVQDSLAEAAMSLEKLTQSISKRKKQISRIASYTIASLCSSIELRPPPRDLRSRLDASGALLLQASDSGPTIAFLKRALAGSPGHVTLNNLYAMYKKYHKYVGNS